MKRTLLIILAVLGLVATACTEDSGSTEAAGGLSSEDASADDGSSGEADEGGEDATQDGETDVEDAGTDDAGADSADLGSTAGLGQGTTLRSAVLGRALDQSNAMTSASFEGSITIVAGPDAELPGELMMSFAGAFDTEAEASQVTLDLGGLVEAALATDPETEGMDDLIGSMFEDPMQMITIGEQSWVKWGLLAMFGVEDKWLEGSTDAAASTVDLGFGTGSSSPTSILDELADADAEVVEVGQEELRGVTTTHYRAELDTEALAATMSPEERAEFEQEMGASPEASYVIDLWIDGEDLLHRFELAVSGLDGEDEFESMTMVYDLWDHGLDPGIAPPPADEVITEAELGFGLEDLGGLGG